MINVVIAFLIFILIALGLSIVRRLNKRITLRAQQLVQEVQLVQIPRQPRTKTSTSASIRATPSGVGAGVGKSLGLLFVLALIGYVVYLIFQAVPEAFWTDWSFEKLKDKKSWWALIWLFTVPGLACIALAKIGSKAWNWLLVPFAVLFLLMAFGLFIMEQDWEGKIRAQGYSAPWDAKKVEETRKAALGQFCQQVYQVGGLRRQCLPIQSLNKEGNTVVFIINNGGIDWYNEWNTKSGAGFWRQGGRKGRTGAGLRNMQAKAMTTDGLFLIYHGESQDSSSGQWTPIQVWVKK